MKPVQQITLPRKLLGWLLLTFGCLCIFFLDRTDIVMNASNSLEEPAYLMLEHPVLLSRGTVISAAMPEVLKAKFGDLHYVKRIGGLPGDEITLDAAGTPCIGDHCYPPFLKDGQPIAPVMTAGVIPDDHYAVFGTSADSLDSRYAVIGLIHRDQLLGRGWAMPFMSDWRVSELTDEAKGRPVR